MSENV